MSTKTILLGAASMVTGLHAMNKAEMEKWAKQYWDACNYPRKTKKKMRKQAIKNYELFSWMNERYFE